MEKLRKFRGIRCNITKISVFVVVLLLSMPPLGATACSERAELDGKIENLQQLRSNADKQCKQQAAINKRERKKSEKLFKRLKNLHKEKIQELWDTDYKKAMESLTDSLAKMNPGKGHDHAPPRENQ